MATPNDQVLFVTDGTDAGDTGIKFVNSNGTTATTLIVDTGQDTPLQGPFAVVADTAAGLYFVIAPQDTSGTTPGQLFVGNLNSPASLTHVYSTPAPANVQPGNAGEIDALAIDTTNHIVYAAVNLVNATQDDFAAGTGIISFSYDPVTHAVSGPTDVLTRGAGATNDPGINKIQSIALDTVHHKLYYVEDDEGVVPNPATDTATNSIKVYDTQTHAFSTVVSLAAGANFPADYTSGAIKSVTVDTADNLIFFSTITGDGTGTHAGIWVVKADGTGLREILATPNSQPLDLAYDSTNHELFVSTQVIPPNTSSPLIKYTVDDGNGHTNDITAGNVTLSGPVNIDLHVQTGATAFPEGLFVDVLPTLTVTSAGNGAIQGGPAVTLLSADTISDPGNGDLASASVKITGGFHAGDVLAANTTGTHITASYDAATGTLTLTGFDTLADYQQVLDSVTFQDTGTDTTVGHPTRTITWHVSDGAVGDPSGPNTQTTAITIDRPPVAVNDTATDLQGATVTSTATTQVLANDSDPDGDTLTVTAVNGNAANVGHSLAGSFGHLTLNADGSYSYVADNAAAIAAAATGSHPLDVFTYTESDGHGGTATATLTITLDRNPVAVNDTAADLSGATVTSTATTQVLANDTDPDGDTLTVTAINGNAANVGHSLAGSFGHLTLNADGSYSYVADNAAAIAAAGSHPQDVFTYTESDGHGGTANATLTITLDRAPVAVNDTAADVQGATLTSTATTQVLANDSDPDGDTLTVTAVNGNAANVGHSLAGSFGHLTLNADGSYSYVADNAAAIAAAATGSHPQDVFTYTESDGHGGTASATLTITLDRNPIAVNDTATDLPGATVNSTATTQVLANDSDPDGDTLTVTAINGDAANVGHSLAGSFGHLTLNADGSYSYVADNAAAIAAAANGGHIQDVFTYTESDGHGGTANATLTITLDRNPIAVNDTASDLQGATVNSTATTQVLANDSDPDGGTLTVTAVNGNTANVGHSLAGNFGHLTLNADGSYSYVADNAAAIAAAATGGHPQDVFTYTETDTQGRTASATLTINIDRVPIAVNDTATDLQGATVTSTATTQVLANDTDPDGDPLAVTAVNGNAANVGHSLAGSFGHLTLNADGSYSYVADNAAAIAAAATGSHPQDVFTYTESDGHGGTASATLTITLDRNPVAVNDTATDRQGATVTSTNTTQVLANDSDPDGDTLTVSAVNGNAANVGHSLAGSFGHLTLNADGSYSYVADNAAALAAAATGSHVQDVFTYTESDGHGGTANATLTITIDRNPIAVNDTAADLQGATVTSTNATQVLANDSDPDGGTLTVTAVNGTAANVGHSLAGSFGHLTLNADGSYSYVADSAAAIAAAAAGHHPQDVFTYTETDSQGATASATLTITIDRNPVAVNDTAAATAGIGGTATADAAHGILVNDTDLDGDLLTVTAVTGAHGAGTIGHSLAGAHGNLTLNADGSYSYTVTDLTGATGSHLHDVFTYTESDGHGGTASAQLDITLDRKPIANADTASVIADQATAAADRAHGLLANDTDPDGDLLTVTGVTGSHGAGALSQALAGSFGHLTLNADGSYTYTADNAASLANGQTGTDVFTYTESDGHGGTAMATLTVTVTGKAQGSSDGPAGVGGLPGGTPNGTPGGPSSGVPGAPSGTPVGGGPSSTPAGGPSDGGGSNSKIGSDFFGAGDLHVSDSGAPSNGSDSHGFTSMAVLAAGAGTHAGGPSSILSSDPMSGFGGTNHDTTGSNSMGGTLQSHDSSPPTNGSDGHGGAGPALVATIASHDVGSSSNGASGPGGSHSLDTAGTNSLGGLPFSQSAPPTTGSDGHAGSVMPAAISGHDVGSSSLFSSNGPSGGNHGLDTPGTNSLGLPFSPSVPATNGSDNSIGMHTTALAATVPGHDAGSSPLLGSNGLLGTGGSDPGPGGAGNSGHNTIGSDIPLGGSNPVTTAPAVIGNGPSGTSLSQGLASNTLNSQPSPGSDSHVAGHTSADVHHASGFQAPDDMHSGSSNPWGVVSGSLLADWHQAGLTLPGADGAQGFGHFGPLLSDSHWHI